MPATNTVLQTGPAPVSRVSPQFCVVAWRLSRTSWSKKDAVAAAVPPTRKGTRLSPWKTPTTPRPRFAGRRRIVRWPSVRIPSSTGAVSAAALGVSAGCAAGAKPSRRATSVTPTGLMLPRTRRARSTRPADLLTRSPPSCSPRPPPPDRHERTFLPRLAAPGAGGRGLLLLDAARGEVLEELVARLPAAS